MAMKQSTNLTECTDCKKEFEITKLFTRIFTMCKQFEGEKVYEYYFICPHCSREYICYYENVETLKIQKQITRGKMDRTEKRKPFEDLQQRVKEYKKWRDET